MPVVFGLKLRSLEPILLAGIWLGFVLATAASSFAQDEKKIKSKSLAQWIDDLKTVGRWEA
jgi:hypothetical protein